MKTVAQLLKTKKYSCQKHIVNCCYVLLWFCQ